MQANGQLFQCMLMLAAELPPVQLWASEQRDVICACAFHAWIRYSPCLMSVSPSNPGKRTVQDKELLA